MLSVMLMLVFQLGKCRCEKKKMEQKRKKVFPRASLISFCRYIPFEQKDPAPVTLFILYNPSVSNRHFYSCGTIISEDLSGPLLVNCINSRSAAGGHNMDPLEGE